MTFIHTTQEWKSIHVSYFLNLVRNSYSSEISEEMLFIEPRYVIGFIDYLKFMRSPIFRISKDEKSAILELMTELEASKALLV